MFNLMVYNMAGPSAGGDQKSQDGGCDGVTHINSKRSFNHPIMVAILISLLYPAETLAIWEAFYINVSSSSWFT